MNEVGPTSNPLKLAENAHTTPKKEANSNQLYLF